LSGKKSVREKRFSYLKSFLYRLIAAYSLIPLRRYPEMPDMAGKRLTVARISQKGLTTRRVGPAAYVLDGKPWLKGHFPVSAGTPARDHGVADRPSGGRVT
jgi:hypothetical protein